MSKDKNRVIRMGDGDPRLTCFKSPFVLPGCACKARWSVMQQDVIDEVVRGGTTCKGCGTRRSLRESLRDFPYLGRLEAVFGLDVWVFPKEIPPSTEHKLVIMDPSLTIPYEGELVFANISIGCSEHDGFDQIPYLLAPQEMHYPWPLHMTFYVPPGGQRLINVMVIVKPKDGVSPALDLGIQAVQAFHRRSFGLASLLLASAVEATLRPLIEKAYGERGVKLPEEIAYASLIERARMLYEPALGSQFVTHLKDLAREGRNPFAHGMTTSVTGEQVAGWMADVAALFEWCTIATLLGAPGSPASKARSPRQRRK
jgi:hypothetical protein